jgi:hypothetical protein
MGDLNQRISLQIWMVDSRKMVRSADSSHIVTTYPMHHDVKLPPHCHYSPTKCILHLPRYVGRGWRWDFWSLPSTLPVTVQLVSTRPRPGLKSYPGKPLKGPWNARSDWAGSEPGYNMCIMRLVWVQIPSIRGLDTSMSWATSAFRTSSSVLPATSSSV